MTWSRSHFSRLAGQIILPCGDGRGLTNPQNRVVDLRVAEAVRLLALQPQSLTLKGVMRKVVVAVGTRG